MNRKFSLDNIRDIFSKAPNTEEQVLVGQSLNTTRVELDGRIYQKVTLRILDASSKEDDNLLEQLSHDNEGLKQKISGLEQKIVALKEVIASFDARSEAQLQYFKYCLQEKENTFALLKEGWASKQAVYLAQIKKAKGKKESRHPGFSASREEARILERELKFTQALLKDYMAKNMSQQKEMGKLQTTWII